MIIVAGHLSVDPSGRDEYVAACRPVVEAARAATGCLDFAITADPIDAARVRVFERWRELADVERFRGAGPDVDFSDRILDAEVSEFEVSSERSLTG